MRSGCTVESDHLSSTQGRSIYDLYFGTYLSCWGGGEGKKKVKETNRLVEIVAIMS